MGLAQRRISQAFQTEHYPEWKSKLLAALTFDVPIEIKWESMLDDSYAEKDQYFNWYAKVYFQPLIETFKHICQDDMGKDALKTALKKIVIDGTEGSSYRATKFEGGTLFINHKFNTNVDSIDERTKGWTELLESKI